MAEVSLSPPLGSVLLRCVGFEFGVRVGSFGLEARAWALARRWWDGRGATGGAVVEVTGGVGWGGFVANGVGAAVAAPPPPPPPAPGLMLRLNLRLRIGGGGEEEVGGFVDGGFDGGGGREGGRGYDEGGGGVGVG